MIRWLLRKFGFYKCDYGFSCGRHWVEIDGKTICQSPRDDLHLADEDVCDLAFVIFDQGKHWKEPQRLADRRRYWERMDRRCVNCGEIFKFHHQDYLNVDRDNDHNFCPKIDASRVHQGWLKSTFKQEIAPESAQEKRQ